jgi:hypothetical protein
MEAMARPLRPWQVVVGHVMKTAVGLALWGVPGAMLLTGIVLWHDWHALARGGVEGTGLVQRCEWEATGSVKYRRTRSGYFSCDYSYRTSPAGPVYQGYFQSPHERRPGDAIPIRFLRERPQTSAAAETLANPTITAGAMIAVGAGLLVWVARGRRQSRPR